MIDREETTQIFSFLKAGELRPFKQFVELYGANLDTRYVANYTPLMECVYTENEEFIHYIVSHIQEKYKNNHEKYKKFINATSTDGKTALMIATLSNSHCRIIKYLLKIGADPKIKDLHGKTAKDYGPFAINEDVENFWKKY